MIPFYNRLLNTKASAVSGGTHAKVCGDLRVSLVPASAAAVVDARDVPSQFILGNEVYKAEPTSKTI